MEAWLHWAISGIVMILSELVIPGGVVVFLGVAALLVAAAIYIKAGEKSRPKNQKIKI